MPPQKTTLKTFYVTKPPLRNSTSSSYIHQMLHLKQENIFRSLGIEFVENCKHSKFRLTASQPAHIRNPRRQTKHCTAQFITTNSLVRCAFWGSDKCGASARCCSFYLPLGSSSSCSKSKTISMCYQHFPWTVYLDATTSILKHLHYSRGIGQVQIWYFECKIRA